MCCITGFVKGKNDASPEQLGAEVMKLLRAGFERGRDGFGYTAFTSRGDLAANDRLVPKERGENLELGFDDGAFHGRLMDAILKNRVFLSNHRAEPTTEFILNKTLADQQPYNCKSVWMVHNGVVANDRELRETHDHWKLKPTDIDSYVIAQALTEYLPNTCFTDLLKGSMAVAAFETNGASLDLYRNYQPLYIFTNQFGSLLFSSLHNAKDLLSTYWRPVSFPPYSKLTIYNNGGRHGSTQAPLNRGRALVVCSGGLDSSTVAAIASDECQSVKLLHFLYSCKAEENEAKAVFDIAAALRRRHPEKDITLDFVDMKWLGRLGGSTLTEEHGQVTKGDAAVEFAHEWVPARNTAMIGIAASYADRFNCGSIYLGLNMEESGAYPDNTIEFFHEFNRVLAVGTQARPEIRNPLANFMKHEIVKLALEIGAPIDKAWSCYEAGELPCGECGPDIMRQVAFQMNGLKDPLVYRKPKGS